MESLKRGGGGGGGGESAILFMMTGVVPKLTFELKKREAVSCYLLIDTSVYYLCFTQSRVPVQTRPTS